MKTTKWRTHAIFDCADCGKRWEGYETAQKNAWSHAKRKGHTVRGEVGYAVTYDGKEKS
jgi:hypothetical protein